jgi:predicted nucleic acid-binding protein
VIVIDSSVALQWVLPEDGAAQADRFLTAPDTLAPDIVLIEAADVLAKKVRAKDMSGAEALDALDIVGKGLKRLESSADLAGRALELSILLSYPVYDCVFLACAERLEAVLVTRDAPFRRRAAERGFGHLFAEVAQ